MEPSQAFITLSLTLLVMQKKQARPPKTSCFFLRFFIRMTILDLFYQILFKHYEDGYIEHMWLNILGLFCDKLPSSAKAL